MRQFTKTQKRIFFLLGLVLLFFSNGRYAFEPISFVAPVFLLLAGRKEKPLKVYVLYSCGMGIVYLFSFWKFSSTNVADLLFYLPFLLGFLLAIPYVVDVWVHQKKSGVLADLMFPLCYVVVEYLYANLSPLGSTGCIAYAQSHFLILLQLLSITGIYGITFVVFWCGSSMATLVTDGIKSRTGRRALYSYLVVFVIVSMYGAIRLIPRKQETVQISGISVYDQRNPDTKAIWRQADDRTEEFRAFCENNLNRLEEKTRQEAKNGSKIIVWAELNPWEYDETQEICQARMSALAQELGIYLVSSPYVFVKEEGSKDINKAEIYGPDGTQLITHIKYGGAMLDGIVEGDKKLQSLDTEYGKIGTVVCWDADFPRIITQMGRMDVDMLFSPAADWKEITPLHSYNAYYRGIENGMSVIRETATGQSFISDCKGRVIATLNHCKSSGPEWIIRGDMPVKGCKTIYSTIRDLFAYLCMAAFLILFVLQIADKKRKI